MTPEFESYSPDFRRAIFIARQEALKRRARMISPEHLLLGVLLGDSSAALPIGWPPEMPPLETIRQVVTKSLPSTSPSASEWEISLSAETKSVVRVAGALRRCPDGGITLRHLLGALTRYDLAFTKLLGLRFSAKRYLARVGFVGLTVERYLAQDKGRPTTGCS